MSFDTLGDLNWLAVIVGTIAYFMLGALWYSPVFLGKPWMRAVGMDQSEMEQGPGPSVYIAPLVGYFISAVATGMIAAATGSTTVGDGLVLGLVVGIGYSAVVAGLTATFSPKMPEPMTWFWITASYNLLGLLIVAVLVSVWD
jgi:Protein of unknown function (DUF1761)